MLKQIRRSPVRYLIFAAVTLLFVLWVIHINRVEKTPLINTEGRSFERAVVTEILSDNLEDDGTRVGQQDLLVRMTTGPLKGQEIETTSSAGYLFGAACTVGMHVIVIQSIAGTEQITTVYAQDRENAIYFFVLLYLALLILIGGKQGLRGALGLLFDFFGIIFVYLPLVYTGLPPILTAVFLCAILTAVTMTLIGGFTKKALTAALGTMAGVAMAALMAVWMSAATGLTGWNISIIESLLDLWYTDGIQVGGLLFAGILISALGAVMDVAMSLTSAMQEITVQNPSISRRELIRAGFRVGRDMMGTDSNTLILAFAGGSLPMLVLDYAYDLPYRQIINSNIIGISILQGLAGSFGVVLCVPLTVLLAAALLCPEKAADAGSSASQPFDQPQAPETTGEREEVF